MADSAERLALRVAAGGLVTAVLVLAAIPTYLTLAPAWRPLGLRLACAAVVVAVCVRIVANVRRAAEAGPASALDAPERAAPPPELDDRFVRLRDEIVFSTRSRRYFDTVLWPRLLALGGDDLPAPSPRRTLRRDGPSASTLADLIAEVERRA